MSPGLGQRGMATFQPVAQKYAEDVRTGQELPRLVKRPTAVQLFLYSALRWLAHRIHYDKDWAISEGLPGSVVHGPLHGAFLCQVVTQWMGPEGWIQEFEYRIERPAIPGDTLTCQGKVIQQQGAEWPGVFRVELWSSNQRGEMVARGQAVVALPSRVNPRGVSPQ